VDLESVPLRSGLRLRVPYGTLLAVLETLAQRNQSCRVPRAPLRARGHPSIRISAFAALDLCAASSSLPLRANAQLDEPPFRGARRL